MSPDLLKTGASDNLPGTGSFRSLIFPDVLSYRKQSCPPYPHCFWKIRKTFKICDCLLQTSVINKLFESFSPFFSSYQQLNDLTWTMTREYLRGKMFWLKVDTKAKLCFISKFILTTVHKMYYKGRVNLIIINTNMLNIRRVSNLYYRL